MWKKIKWSFKSESPEKTKEKRFLKKFETESDSRVSRFSGLCITMAIAFGMYLKVYEVFVPRELVTPPKGSDVFVVQIPKMEKKPKTPPTKKPSKPTKVADVGRGNPHVPLSKQRIFELSSKSKSSVHRAFEMIEKNLKDVDEVLKKTNVLTRSGGSETGERKGKERGEFNAGQFAGTNQGIDDLLGSLWETGPSTIRTTAVEPVVQPPQSKEIGLSSESRRSAASILRTIRQHMPGLRHTYNQYLKQFPGFSGKLHLKFEISPSGKVVSVVIVDSSTGVAKFDGEIMERVKRWRFEPIRGKGTDVVTIPFTFSE